MINPMNKCAYDVETKSVYGEEVSEYGIERNKLDYGTLARIIRNMGGCILNNQIMNALGYCDFWELYNGSDYDEETDEYEEFYQYYIIDDEGAKWLQEHSHETVYYNEHLDLFVWAIDHYGTAWSHVATDIELVPFDEFFELN